MTSPPGRLGVGVVGAGRVGAVLGSALRATGHAVVGASGSSEHTLERIDVMLPGVPVLDVEVVVERSELVLLTVPDDVLPDLVAGLARLGAFQPGQLVVHTAGRFGTDVLAPARAAGAIPLAIHPAMTFTGTSVDLTRIVGAPFAVTAPGPVLPIAQALVVEIGGEPVVLDEAARGLYHAALAHGGNHLVTLASQAMRLLGAAGVSDGGMLLAPLLTTALDGALRGGDATVTGPVVRGDAGTVAEHLRAISTARTPEDDLVDVPPTYRALARATVQRALAGGRLDEAKAARLLDVLETQPAADEPSAAGRRGLRVLHTIAELRQARSEMTGRCAVVMTMGALHAGHLALVREARSRAPHVVVTVFVNPLQFTSSADLESYPRTLDADLAALEREGVDLVFAPSAAEIYPGGDQQVRLSAGRMGEVLEGVHRPGHFDGMLTVVSKLLHLTAPDIAVFGQKDAQQLAIVRRMVTDLNLPVEIVGVPIVRDDDGLALSSRNVHLSAGDRKAALVLSAAVHAGVAAAQSGATPEQVLAAARDVLAGADPNQVRVEYAELVDPSTMSPYDGPAGGPALLAVAAQVGSTRLIDNAPVEWPEPPTGRRRSRAAGP